MNLDNDNNLNNDFMSTNGMSGDEPLDGKIKEMISKSWGNYCSSCGAKKDAGKLKIFKKVGPATQILSECEECGLKTLITVIPNIGMQINQIRTDIVDPQEFERFNGPVTTNDYLNFYNSTKDIRTASDLINAINNVK